jgi:hypothetical protein
MSETLFSTQSETLLFHLNDMAEGISGPKKRRESSRLKKISVQSLRKLGVLRG